MTAIIVSAVREKDRVWGKGGFGSRYPKGAWPLRAMETFAVCGAVTDLGSNADRQVLGDDGGIAAIQPGQRSRLVSTNAGHSAIDHWVSSPNRSSPSPRQNQLSGVAFISSSSFRQRRSKAKLLFAAAKQAWADCIRRNLRYRSDP